MNTILLIIYILSGPTPRVSVTSESGRATCIIDARAAMRSDDIGLVLCVDKTTNKVIYLESRP